MSWRIKKTMAIYHFASEDCSSMSWWKCQILKYPILTNKDLINVVFLKHNIIEMELQLEHWIHDPLRSSLDRN